MSVDKLFNIVSGVEYQLNILKDAIKVLDKEEQEKVDEAYKRGYKDCETRYCSFDACPNRQAEYQRGLDAAWEAAKKIVEMWTRIDNDELLAIFGITERIGHSTIRSMFEKQTANEAIEKLKAYEEKQKEENEIKVGDEVRHDRGWTAVVTSIDDDGLSVMDYNGTVASYSDISKFTKTSRHFDIEKILEAMRHD